MLGGPSKPKNDKDNEAARAPDPSGYAVPEKPTVGEKIWKQSTYIGVGYVANLIVSLAIWDSLLSGKGRPLFNKVSQGVGSALKATGMEAGKASKLAEDATKMACSPLGGHVMMVPTVLMERKARHIAHKLNQVCDKDYEHKDLKTNRKTPKEELPPLVQEPSDQTWSQAAARRGLAWATVTAAGTGLAKMGLDVPLENKTLQVANKAIEMSGSETLKTLNKNPNGAFSRWTKLAALDVYFTVITSAVVYLTNNMFSKDKKRDSAAPSGIPGEEMLQAANTLATVEGAAQEAAQKQANFRQNIRKDAPEPALRGMNRPSSHAERVNTELTAGPALG